MVSDTSGPRDSRYKRNVKKNESHRLREMYLFLMHTLKVFYICFGDVMVYSISDKLLKHL